MDRIVKELLYDRQGNLVSKNNILYQVYRTCARTIRVYSGRTEIACVRTNKHFTETELCLVCGIPYSDTLMYRIEDIERTPMLRRISAEQYRDRVFN